MAPTNPRTRRADVSLDTSFERDRASPHRAVPFDVDRPRSSHPELGGHGVSPRTPLGCTCALPGMTIPGIVMLAPTRTVPTSTSPPEVERNSMVKVFRPLRSVPVGDSTTTSNDPDRAVCTTRPSSDEPVRGAAKRASQADREAHHHDSQHGCHHHTPPAAPPLLDHGTYLRKSLALQSELSFTNRQEDDRRHDQHVEQRRHHAAQHRRRPAAS